MFHLRRVGAVLLSVYFAASAFANRHWIDPGGGSYTDVGNWSTVAGGPGGASVPVSIDNMFFEVAAAPPYQVGFPGRAITDPPLGYPSGGVYIGGNSVTFADTGGLNKIPALVTSQEMEIGSPSSPSVLTTTLADFRVHSVDIQASVGNPTNTLNVNGGTFTITNSDTALRIGCNQTGQAIMNVAGGGDVIVNGTTPVVVVGRYVATTTSGTLSVSGAGSTFTINNNGSILLGDYSMPGGSGPAATGTLNVLAGGSVSDSVAYLAFSSGSTGNATVDGAGSTWTSTDLNIGYRGPGTVNVTGGGLVSSTNATLGHRSGANGAAVVQGTGSQFNVTGTLEVGSVGQGTLTVRNGGTMNTIDTYLGRLAGGVGSMTVDALLASATWNNTGQLTIGSANQGTLNILHGGQFFSAGVTLGAGVGSSGTATVDGSTWANIGPLNIGVEGTGTLNIIGSHATTTGYALLGATATGAGIVTVGGGVGGALWEINNGDLVVNGNGTGASSVTLVNGGSIQLTSPNPSQMHLIAQGNLRGSGSVIGRVANDGIVSPGTSVAPVGILHVTGNYDQTLNGVLKIELGGTTPGTEFDQLHVSGQLSLGGTLDVDFVDLGAGRFVPAAGNSFDILDGKSSGSFSSLTLPPLGSDFVWNLSNLYTTGVLSVGIAGDYNNNGTVDGADYVLWRNGGPLQNEVDTPGVVNAADYTAWRARFGNSGSGASVNENAAPEPATTVLLIILAAAGVFSRQCRSMQRVPRSH